MCKVNTLLSVFLALLFWARAFVFCSDSTTAKNDMLRYINSFKAQGGSCGGTYYPAVAPLALSSYLVNAASNHAWDMAQYNYFSHIGRNGSTPTDRIRATGYLNGATSCSLPGDVSCKIPAYGNCLRLQVDFNLFPLLGP